MASSIRILEPSLIDRIAAGEVIERPASVVKELVENSLDAGATEVAVLLEGGGKSLIEVVDNGAGMDADDLALCARRHATSKLRSADQLDRLSSLGFRGEALPSIAAVSDLSILSRPSESPSADAAEIRLPSAGTTPDAGQEERAKPITFGTFVGSRHGTRVRALGLFSRIPARLKFLQSQGTELAQIRGWAERLAAAQPGVAIRLVSDGRTLLHLRPQTELGRAASLLGAGSTDLVAHASGEALGGAARIRLYWAPGLQLPHSRKIIQIVNGRPVRDRELQETLIAPLRSRLMPRESPAVMLYLDLDPGLVDVNVHPSKVEVRFLRPREIHTAIQSLLASLVAARSPREWMSDESRPSAEAPTGPSKPGILELHGEGVHPFRRRRYLGTAFETYLLYDLGGELVWIDQHAADERVRFERLSRALASDLSRRDSQPLERAESVAFSPEKREKIASRLEWFERIGFEAEFFGEDRLLFRAVPAQWRTGSLVSRLQALVARLSSSSPSERIGWDRFLLDSLASEACHSSVKAGTTLSQDEAMALVDALFECELPWNCPHGRPTLVRLPKTRIEEWFKR